MSSNSTKQSSKASCTEIATSSETSDLKAYYEEILGVVFEMIDMNGDSSICVNDLKKLLTGIDQHHDEIEIENMIKNFTKNPNCNGMIVYQEFQQRLLDVILFYRTNSIFTPGIKDSFQKSSHIMESKLLSAASLSLEELKNISLTNLDRLKDEIASQSFDTLGPLSAAEWMFVVDEIQESEEKNEIEYNDLADLIQKYLINVFYTLKTLFIGNHARNCQCTSEHDDQAIKYYFMITKKPLACGSFGCVFPVLNLLEKKNDINHDENTFYALKIEDLDCYPSQLGYEAKVYRALQGGTGISTMYSYRVTPHYKMLVMDMLGDSLQGLLEKCNHRLSYTTLLMVAEQMIRRLEYMHSKNYIHRDLKPANFAMGVSGSQFEKTVFILDFGLSKEINSRKKKGERDHNFVGTTVFISRAAHKGLEQGRNDDLESLGYVLLYLLGKLPWLKRDDSLNTEEFFDQVIEKKQNLPLKDYGDDIPSVILKYLEYCRGLSKNDEPNYALLKAMFQNEMEERNISYLQNYKFDWSE